MTEPEVRKLLKENKIPWAKFAKWMFGQTVGMGKDGKINYYEWDVKRFVHDLEGGKKKEHWAAWD